MKKIAILVFPFLLFSCDQNPEPKRGVSQSPVIRGEIPEVNIDSTENDLTNKGYKTFQYKEGDTTYLMQQYYIVFLKKGENRTQDSIETARLQKRHLAHLSKLAEEGFISLAGPFGEDGDIRGIVIFNTPSQKAADSLARLDPMVKAGRLKVEVHPWWAAKGGKLR